MKKIYLLFLGLFFVGLANSFAQSKAIYVNPEFKSFLAKHEVLAVLPFKTTMKLRPRQMEKLSEQEFMDLQLKEGFGVQNALHSYFLKKKAKKGYTVDFQDPSRTNTLLKKAGVTYDNIEDFLPEELAKICGVDGIIHGIMHTSKPMSDGASIALGLLVGFYGPTNSGNIIINVNDGETGTLLWKYDKQLSRSLGSDTNTMVDAIMRKASRKFPYTLDN